MLKRALAAKVNELLDLRYMNQIDAATLLGIPQPRVSAIRNYRLRGISVHRLLRVLTALGRHVEIVGRTSSKLGGARIDLAA